MRTIVWLALFALMVAVLPQAATAQPLVQGNVLVIFGDGAGYRSDSVLAGVRQALAQVPGVTVLVPRTPIWSLQDADLAGVDTVVRIGAADVLLREDRNTGASNGGFSGQFTRTTVAVRLSLEFLRVIGNGAYLTFFGAREARGSASGTTYVSIYTQAGGSYSASASENLEIAAFQNAAANIFGR